MRTFQKPVSFNDVIKIHHQGRCPVHDHLTVLNATYIIAASCACGRAFCALPSSVRYDVTAVVTDLPDVGSGDRNDEGQDGFKEAVVC